MDISVSVIIALVVAVLVLGMLLRRFRQNRYVPYIIIAGALFFLIYAILNREYFYPSLFFVLIFGYSGIKALLAQKNSGQ